MKSLQSTIQAHRRRTTTTATNMATVLEHYNDLKVKITAQISSGSFPANQMLQYQEMLYRIDVLETCMAFVKTEPVVYEGGGSDHRGVHQVMPVRTLPPPINTAGLDRRSTCSSLSLFRMSVA